MFGYINAIVLSDSRLGEIDRRYKVFSDRLGEISIIARRGYLLRYPSSGILNSLNHVRILLFKGGISDSYYVLESEIVSEFRNIKQDMDRVISSYYILYIIDNLYREYTTGLQVFKMLLTYFNILESSPRPDYLILKDAFLWKLAVELGFLPGLEKCSVCGKALKSEKLRFSISSGGLICEDCSGPELESRLISRGSLNFLKRIISSEFKDTLSLKYTGLAAKELKSLSESYLRYHSERGVLSFDNFANSYKIKRN